MNASLMELEGKTALATGSTSGIGKATASALARRGAAVIVTGRDAERGARVVKEIADDGGSARFVAADLSDPGQVTQLAQEAGAAPERIDAWRPRRCSAVVRSRRKLPTSSRSCARRARSM